MTRSGSKRRKARRARLRAIAGGRPPGRFAPDLVNRYAALKAQGCYFDPMRGWLCSAALDVSHLEPCEHVEAAIPNWRTLAAGRR